MQLKLLIPLLLAALLVGFLFSGCASEAEENEQTVLREEPLFAMRSPQETGIEFSNTLRQTPGPSSNQLLYEYFTNGAGVAVGDLNGDGLEDVYLVGNMSYNTLYMNQGDLKFTDVTDVAGVGGRVNTWKTGVSIVDVNGDGRLDVYVCYSGDLPLERRIDELYINTGNDPNGNPVFEEQAEAYGLVQPHSSNQGYFFDYDRDGDLDLFLLTHNVENTQIMDLERIRRQLATTDPVSGFHFYRNDGERFTDVTAETGILNTVLSYGLGVAIADYNRDGWLDLYVGNDYSPPDYLYYNNGDGTFTDRLGEQMGHTSNASMGMDAADLNNDGWTDLFVLDMLPEDNRRQKTLFLPSDRRQFAFLVEAGFHRQYHRNTLQVNNGNGTFSEIGQLDGLSNTDWSWTPLLADLNNDGWKDIFVTNGLLHDATDRDFLLAKSQFVAAKQQALEPADIQFLLTKVPLVDLNNYVFQNDGAWRFSDRSVDWGLSYPLISTGAAYSDLDNDGDLDLITNNINDFARVFENQSDKQGGNYVQITLQGGGRNPFAIGAHVSLYQNGEGQYLDHMPHRGYLSTVSSVLHFGVGDHVSIDSLVIRWPDGTRQKREDLSTNQRLVIQKEAGLSPQIPFSIPEPLFTEVTSPISFNHAGEDAALDFQRQPLLVHTQSDVGPAMAKGDVNGDGLEDVFVGGGAGQASRLFIQRTNGSFEAASATLFAADAAGHDTDAAFLDVDQNGTLDLYVARGGYGRFEAGDEAMQDVLYLNDGSGGFNKSELPLRPAATGAVAVLDANADGWPDVFASGAVVPGRFPETSKGMLLINDGAGRFGDRTEELAPALSEAGLVTDVISVDMDNDGIIELVVAAAWAPLRVFAVTQNGLEDRSDTYFEIPYSGIWNALWAGDLNKDGRTDLIAGNLGLNSQIKASPEAPAQIHAADFDNDGRIDPIFSTVNDGVRYPHALLEELYQQLPTLATRFTSHAQYGTTALEGVFPENLLAAAEILEARNLETMVFYGTETGRLEAAALPAEAQFMPVHIIQVHDYDGDEIPDILLAGNKNEGQIRLGRQDAGYGMLLRGRPEGGYNYIPQWKSGLKIKGAIRDVVTINKTLLFGMNQGRVVAYHKGD